MRMLREVLRLYLALGATQRAISRSCTLSPSTVNGYVGRAKVAKLKWPLPAELDDDLALTKLLFPDERNPQRDRQEPDWSRVLLELKRKHVTKALLWEEYKTEQPNGYQYSQFCERYARWAARVNVVMRQEHRAGEKMFIDVSGDGITIVDPKTGECVVAKLFLAVLGASNLTYVEPVLSEDLPSWTGGHVRALEYFGGVSGECQDRCRVEPQRIAASVDDCFRRRTGPRRTAGAGDQFLVLPDQRLGFLARAAS